MVSTSVAGRRFRSGVATKEVPNSTLPMGLSFSAPMVFGSFTRKTRHRKAIGAVGGYLELNYLVVEAYCLADILAHGLIAVVAENKYTVLDGVGKVMHRKPQFIKRAEHTV